MNIQVYHHGYCHDGFGAAWVAHRALGEEATYHHMMHGDKVIKNAWPADHVYFLDAAPSPEDAVELLRRGIQVTIIDHHKSNVERYQGINHPLLTTRFDTSFSAAVLTWFHFFGSEPLPTLLQYIQDYDLWTLELEGTKEVLAGLRLEPFDFTVWSSLMGSVATLKARGHIALLAERRAYKRQIKELHYKKVMGVDIPMINLTCCWNEAMEELKQTLRAPVVGYYFDRANLRVYGLRGNGTVDVSEIARSMGGGGHRDAAGFQVRLDEVEL